MATIKVNVWFNDGRWIVRCPKCQSQTQIKPARKIKYLKLKWYCGACYPGKIQRELKVGIDGKVSYSYSRKVQMKAAEDAYNADEIYTAIFPKDWQEAEETLRLRIIEHQHYRPHEIHPKLGRPETAADLVIENEVDPLLSYIEIEKLKVAIPAGKIIVAERKKLPPEIYKDLQ